MKNCRHCGKELVRRPNERPGKFLKRVFCDKSCLGLHTNLRFVGKRTKATTCSCGGSKDRTSAACLKCIQNRLLNKTLGEILGDKTYTSTLLTDVRKRARDIIIRSSKKKKCLYCNHDEFKDVLEVCHIRGIMTFPKTARVAEINHIDNLIWLCPSHHAMFDKGLIKN